MMMKKIPITYLYLMMYQALALDCQCERPKMKVLALSVTPSKPIAGEDVCMCCSSLVNLIPTTFSKNGVPVCTVGNIASDGTCTRLNDSLTVFRIGNITTHDAGSWRCNSSYDKSSDVDLTVEPSITTISSSLPRSNSSATKTVTSTMSTTDMMLTLSTENGQSDPTAISVSVGTIIVIVLIAILFILYRTCKRKKRPYDKTDRRYSGRSRNDSNQPFTAEELLQMGTPRCNDDDDPYYLSLNMNTRRVVGATGGVGEDSNSTGRLGEAEATAATGGTRIGGSRNRLALDSIGKTEKVSGGGYSTREGLAIKMEGAGFDVHAHYRQGRVERVRRITDREERLAVEGAKGLWLDASRDEEGTTIESISGARTRPAGVNVSYGRRTPFPCLGVTPWGRNSALRVEGNSAGEEGRVADKPGEAMAGGGSTHWKTRQLSEVERNVMKMLSSHLQTILHTEINPSIISTDHKENEGDRESGQETRTFSINPDAEIDERNIRPGTMNTATGRVLGSYYNENSEKESVFHDEEEDNGSKNNDGSEESLPEYQTIHDEHSPASDDSCRPSTNHLDNAYLHPTITDSEDI